MKINAHYLNEGDTLLLEGGGFRLGIQVTVANAHDCECVYRALNAHDGAALIENERERQIMEEGWTPEHDDSHVRGELIDAGLSYIRGAINVGHPAMQTPPTEWPWDAEWWKPSDDPIRNLVKAGALVAAEIDRLQRLRDYDPTPYCAVCRAPKAADFTCPPTPKDDNRDGVQEFTRITLIQRPGRPSIVHIKRTNQMTQDQEPKYKIEDGKIVNRASGEAIPEDEPIMIFRGRDQKARDAIAFYYRSLENDEHLVAVGDRLAQFNEFARNYPERMHEPDTATAK